MEGKNCVKCNLPCEGEPYIALKDGSNFHPACFTCEMCSQELPLKFALKNGKYFHTDCYSQAKLNAPKCVKCEGPIIHGDISVNYGTDSKFHSRCFVCDICQQPLTEKFQHANDKYIHDECFVCSSCNSALKSKNFNQLEAGGLICDGCLYRQVRAPDIVLADGKPVTGGYSKNGNDASLAETSQSNLNASGYAGKHSGSKIANNANVPANYGYPPVAVPVSTYGNPVASTQPIQQQPILNQQYYMQQQYLQQQQLLLQQQQQVQQRSKTPTSNNGYFAAPAVRQPTQFGQAYMAGYSYSQNGQGYDQSQQAYGNMPQQAYANQQQIMSKPAPQYPPNQRRQ